MILGPPPPQSPLRITHHLLSETVLASYDPWTPPPPQSPLRITHHLLSETVLASYDPWTPPPLRSESPITFCQRQFWPAMILGPPPPQSPLRITHHLLAETVLASYDPWTPPPSLRSESPITFWQRQFWPAMILGPPPPQSPLRITHHLLAETVLASYDPWPPPPSLRSESPITFCRRDSSGQL